MEARWAQRVTTGRLRRLIVALIAAPLGGAVAGLLFDAAVVLLLERETLQDPLRYHGAKPFWFAVLAAVSAPAILLGLTGLHMACAALRLRSVWPYLAAAALAGTAFTFKLNAAWVTCVPGPTIACPPPPAPEMATKIILGNVAIGFAPAIGAALTFWAVLRPDRGVRR